MRKGWMGVTLAFLALLILILGGCSGSAAKPKPEMDFTAEQVGEGLRIVVTTTGWQVGKDGHIHVRLNDGPEAMSSHPTYTIPKLQPGTYKVFVELSDVKHNPLGVSLTKQVEIK